MTHFSSRRLSLLLSGSTTVLSRVETRPGVGGGKLWATQRSSKGDCRRRVRPPASSRLTHNSYYTLSHSHTLASITFTHSHQKVWTTTSGALMQNGDVHLTTIIRGSESLEVWYHRGGCTYLSVSTSTSNYLNFTRILISSRSRISGLVHVVPGGGSP